MTNSERRAFPRIPLLTDVTLTAGDHRHAGAMRDISLGGICVGVTTALEFGSKWTLQMKLPGEADPIRLDAEVAWARGAEAGFTFNPSNTEALARIEAAVQRELSALESFKDEKTPTRETKQ